MFEMTKNQKLFFESAVENFGTLSTEVKLAHIKGFASEFGLKVPGALLGNHCQAGRRGYFDLTKSGFMPSADSSASTPSLGDYAENTQKAIPVVVTPKKKRNNKMIVKSSIKFRNPVYIVSNITHKHIFGTFTGEGAIERAFERRTDIFHDNGDSTLKEVKADIKEKGYSIIVSANSQLTCLIEAFECE